MPVDASVFGQPVTGWPAWMIAEQVRHGRITASEVLQAHLEQIRARNTELNAIVTVAEDSARAQAAGIDKTVASGADPGPLAGVPFTVKDLIATRGLRSTAGSLLLRDYRPSWGATAVDRLVAAAAVLIGKSNCPEFGLALHTRNRLFGETLNPIGPGLSPGGSSGGDAAAVASGMAAFGIGTDYGGSIRLPAHCTGLASLRPTPGLVPGTGQLPFAPGPAPVPPSTVSLQARLQTIGPMARSVADLWPLLQVMAGPDDIDGNTVPVPIGQPETIAVSALAVAWCDGDGSYPVRADLVAVVEAAARALARTGARVAARRPPGLDRAEEVYAALRDLEGLPDHHALAGGHEGQLTDYVRAMLAAVPPPSGPAALRELTAAADQIRTEVYTFMRDWPIVLLPVASVPAFPPGTDRFTVHGEELTGPQIESCCRAVTLLKVPVTVVRCGYSREGLPVGIQVIGRPFHDAETVAVAMALERHFGPDRRLSCLAPRRAGCRGKPIERVFPLRQPTARYQRID
jgi:Asp-tRNA(Asn)/Glu-tRNA(Gln) amidotransferase A subunit family amidase